MHEDLSHVLFVAWTLIALIAMSGLYPARKLFKKNTQKSRSSLWTVLGLAAITPLILFAADNFRPVAPSANNAMALQAMPLPLEALPFLYALSASAAALLLWLLLAWQNRNAA